MEAVGDLITGLAGTPWAYLAVLLVCIIDGFFPPIPSETVVVSMAALAIATGAPHPLLLIITAAVGAFVGDNIAYAIGRGVGTTRFRWMRRARVVRAFDAARHGLERRGALVVFTARYIPVGRIAVNMTAGATRYPRRRFLLLTVLAGTTWALYSTLIGMVAGHWLGDQPLIAVVIAIVFAALIGSGVDLINRRFMARRTPSHAGSSSSTA